MTEFSIINTPGLQTTLQDAGRMNKRHLGIAQSGAADRISFALANHAVGNTWNATALECALTGPALTFLASCTFALGGANMQATLNTKPIELYQSYAAKPGDRLTLRSARAGARSYIAFAGGLSGDDFLGSCSTFLPGEFGGLHGRALQEGDTLQVKNAHGAPQEIPHYLRPNCKHDWLLRTTIGPDAHGFDPKTIRDFFSKVFIPDNRGNRMGQRLIGPAISTHKRLEMKSSAVYPGTVQCPDGGTPFLLLPDAQTTGGYARIAQVISADLNLTGQIRSGDKVWFTLETPETARNVSLKKSAFYSTLMPGFCFD